MKHSVPAVADAPGTSFPPQPMLRSWDGWLQELGRTHTTGWRWRKCGWINPINISGRLYISADEISRFTRRAAAGEFAKEHKVPVRGKESTQ
jgi:hypothetical protein